ncbi:hypothetical protein CBS101457_003826 [Exobasidium rhododendri]|nr:hypothetical protein CBS101457_003826 [Exobasidium rhododendri]
MTTEQELQSLLLRLSILLATSLSTLSEPLPPTIASDASSSSSSSSDAFSQHLCAQILNDVKILLTSVQKSCTNLTLALKPSKHTTTALLEISNDPNSGLDSDSLDAAKAQIADISKNFIPKLIWLSRKASAEAVVFRYIAKTQEDLRLEKEERDFVKLKGGHIVQHTHSRDLEKLEKIKGKGLGLAWSKQVVSVVVELLEALGDLSEAFMSERTLSVLKKASDARAKVDTTPNSDVALLQQPDRSRSEVRQRALQATGIVWEICDAALKGKLPVDNKAAVIASWKSRTEVLQDALREFNEALQNNDGEDLTADASDFDEDDPLAGLNDMTLSAEEKESIRKFEPLLRAGCQLHAKTGAHCLQVGRASDADLDFDDLEEAGKNFSVAVDEIVSTLLYADELRGDDDGSDEDEEDVDSEVQEALDSFHEAVQQLVKAATLPKIDDEIALLQRKIDALIKDLSE